MMNTLEQDVLSKGLFITCDITVATYDTDFQGHVSNIAYLRWLEDMRLMLFDKYFPLQDFLVENKTPVLRSTNIQYKRSVRLFEKPRGIMWVSDVGPASLVIQGRIFVDDELCASAEHVGVFIDIRTGKPIRMPKIVADQFKSGQLGSK